MNATVQTQPTAQLKRRPKNCPIVDHRFHSLSDAELRYVAKDASEAAVNMRGVSEQAECKYLDQVNNVATVLHYRSKGGKRFVVVNQAEDRLNKKVQAILDRTGGFAS